VSDDPPVHVFVMGRNRWQAELDWPLPETRWTEYYLHSGGRANSITGNGSLSTSPPGVSGEAAFDTYTYDPAKPTLSPLLRRNSLIAARITAEALTEVSRRRA